MTNSSTTNSPELVLWNKFLELTRIQSELIAANDAEGLTRSLEDRGKVAEEISKSETDRAKSSSPEFKAIRDEVKRLNDLNAKAVRRWIDDIDDEIRGLKCIHRGVLGYTRAEYAADSIASSFFDESR